MIAEVAHLARPYCGRVSPYLRTVKASSGATAVQIVHSSRRGSRDIEHLGSAHDDAEVELLKAAARQRLAAGQGVLDLGLDTSRRAGRCRSPRRGWAACSMRWTVPGGCWALTGPTGGDEVNRQLVLARIIEPVSKADSARVLEEAGVPPVPYRTVTRRLRVFARDSWRQQISAACAAHARLGPASMVLYDCSTLYFETDEGDGFRESGFSKERRLEPQITIGLLTGADGFPLMVSAFEGNRAETKTMLPVIESFMAAHQLPDVTGVADARMMQESNQKRSRPRACRSSSARRSPRSRTWSRSGAASTPASRSRTGTSSPSPGPPGRTAAATTRSSTTSTGLTGPAAPCAGLTSRSPRPSRPSPGRPR